MRKEEAFQLTRELCSKYGINLRGVKARRKKGTLGTAYTKGGIIIYSTRLFKEGRWPVLKTVCHEVAHLLAAKRFGLNCMHNSKFQDCETQIDALYGFRPVYSRSRGYAVAYLDIKTGRALDCRRGYQVKDGKVVIDHNGKINDRLLRKVMKAAFFAKAFIKGDRYHSMICEPVAGCLALTVENKTQADKVVIYQSELKADDFKINLTNVRHSGRSLRYSIGDPNA